MSMDDPLETLTGASSQPNGSQEQPGGDPLSELMRGLLEGSPQPGIGQVDSRGVADSSGLGGILGALLGGASAGDGPTQLLAPVIEQLTVKLGLTSEVAEAVVAFVLGKLVAGREGGAERLAAGSTDELDLGSLLAQMGSDQGLDEEPLRSTSLPQELAAKTGLDLETAVQVLQQVLAILAGKPVKPAKKKRKRPAKSQAKTKPKSKSKAKPKSTAKTQAKSKPKPKSTAKTQAKSKPKPKSTAKTQAKSKPKSKPKAKSTAKTKPKGTAKAKAKSTGKAPSRSASLDGAESSGGTPSSG